MTELNYDLSTIILSEAYIAIKKANIPETNCIRGKRNGAEVISGGSHNKPPSPH